MKKLKVTVLPGEGVGQDLTLACIPVFDALNIPIDINFIESDFDSEQKSDSVFSNEMIESIKSSDAVLVGNISNPKRNENFNLQNKNEEKHIKHFYFPIDQLNSILDISIGVLTHLNFYDPTAGNKCTIVYPNPSLDIFEKNKIKYKSKNENSNIDNFQYNLDAHDRVYLLDGYAKTKSLLEFAFNYATINECENIYISHQNCKNDDKLFSVIFENIAQHYPELKYSKLKDEINSLALFQNHNPIIIVEDNLDILKDLQDTKCLKFSTAGNFGKLGCYFKPNIPETIEFKPYCINPIGMFLTIACMLNTLGYNIEANLIEKSIQNILVNNQYLMLDLDGISSTLDLANIIIDEISSLKQKNERAYY